MTLADGNRQEMLGAAFRIVREQVIDDLFHVLTDHQPPEGQRTALELRKRAQSIVLGMQEMLTVDTVLPGFCEERGAIACGITDGSDAALIAVTAHLDNALRSHVPAIILADVGLAISDVMMRFMDGWMQRRHHTAADSLAVADAARQFLDAHDGGDGFMAAMVDQAPFGVLVIDIAAGFPVVFNPALEQLFGYSLEEDIALPPEQMTNDESADDNFDMLADMVAGRIPFLERISARPHKDGHSVPYRLLAWPIRDADGAVTHLAHQITAASVPPETAGSGLAEKRARYLLQISPDPMIVAAQDGIIRYASPSVEQAFGHDPDWLVGQPIWVLMTSSSLDVGRDLLEDAARAPRARAVAELEMPLSDGSTRWFEVRATNMLDVEDVQGIVFQGRDVTERHELQERLEHAARIEPLTGVLNRRGFVSELTDWVEQRAADDAAAEEDASIVCFIDLDDFKSVNDVYGHAAGDAVLTEIGARLDALVHGHGFVGRLGGDEFVVLAELVNALDRKAFEDELRAVLDGSITYDNRMIPFTGSVGILSLRESARHDTSVSDILREADDGLRKAKMARRHIRPMR